MRRSAQTDWDQQHWGGTLFLSLVLINILMTVAWLLVLEGLVLSVSETSDYLGFSCTTVSTMVWKTEKKTPSCSAVLMRKVKGGCPDWSWFELTSYQLFTPVLHRKASQNSQYAESWGGWTSTAEEHIGFHACEPRTGIHSGAKAHWTWTVKDRKKTAAH